MTGTVRGVIWLSPVEFSLLWHRLLLGELPIPLLVPDADHAGADAAERALADRGLGGLERPAEDIAGILRILARPDVAMDAFITDAHGLRRCLTAADADRAALAVLDAHGVWLAPVTRQDMVEAALDPLPPVPAGLGRAATMRVADYERACAAGATGGAEAFRDVLRAAGTSIAEINTVERALTRRKGGGQFGVTRWDAGGRRRSRSPLTWLDTPDGRYALRREDDWVEVAPTGAQRLAELADGLLQDT